MFMTVNRSVSWILIHVNYHSHFNLVIIAKGVKFRDAVGFIFQISDSFSKDISGGNHLL